MDAGDLLNKLKQEFANEFDDSIQAFEAAINLVSKDVEQSLNELRKTAHNIKGSAQASGFCVALIANRSASYSCM